MSESLESISNGVEVALKYPVLFVPQLFPIAIDLVFAILARRVFPTIVGVPGGPVMRVPNLFLLFLGTLISSIVGFITGCMIVDMSHDAMFGRAPDLSKSYGEVMSRIGPLIVAAIVAAILSITIILIPVAMFVMVIAVVEKLGAADSVKKAFSFVVDNLGTVIVFVLIVIIVSAILAFIPLIGRILLWLTNVIFTASTVYLYLKLRARSRSL